MSKTPLPTVFPAFDQSAAPGTAEALALAPPPPRLAAADAFVFVTPECHALRDAEAVRPYAA
ncbi:hypothetical protein AB0A70_19645 [Streptomyces morookaense]|uniref:hypothetical protein n=1 Tax=Streptomyces morookaense TaxID=1970 RepID=UPI0033F93359